MFRRLAFVVATAFLFVSCKGPKGDPGSPGQQGPSQIPPVGSNQPVVNEFDGQVGSGEVFVNSVLHTNSIVLVYLENNAVPGELVLLSVTQSTTDPWAEISFPLGRVLFHNCGATNNYKILVITPSN